MNMMLLHWNVDTYFTNRACFPRRNNMIVKNSKIQINYHSGMVYSPSSIEYSFKLYQHYKLITFIEVKNRRNGECWACNINIILPMLHRKLQDCN
jgi:hypothetical protein